MSNFRHVEANELRGMTSTLTPHLRGKRATWNYGTITGSRLLRFRNIPRQTALEYGTMLD